MASPEERAKADIGGAPAGKPGEFSADFDEFSPEQMRAYLDAVVAEAKAAGREVTSICMPPDFDAFLKSAGASYPGAELTVAADYEGMVYGVASPA